MDPSTGADVPDNTILTAREEPTAVPNERTASDINTMLTAEAKELSMLNEMKNILCKAEQNINKVKTEGVQAAFHKIFDLLNIILVERVGLRKARRALVEVAKLSRPDSTLKMVAESVVKQERKLDAMAEKIDLMETIPRTQAEIVETLNGHGAKVDVLLSSVEDSASPSGWSEVVKKKPKSKETPKEPLFQ